MELYVKVRRAVMVDKVSEREAVRLFGVHRKTVKKMCQYAAPPGYQRKSEPISPKLGKSGKRVSVNCLSDQHVTLETIDADPFYLNIE